MPLGCAHCCRHRFFEEIEDLDAKICTAQDLDPEDDKADLSTYDFAADGFKADGSKRKLAYRYRRIRDIYTKYGSTREPCRDA